MVKLDLNQLHLDLANLDVVSFDSIGDDVESVLEELSLGTVGHGTTELGASCGSITNCSGSSSVKEK